MVSNPKRRNNRLISIGYNKLKSSIINLIGLFFGYVKTYPIFVYMKGSIQDTIILNVPSELKKEFKETCSLMGVTMTNILQVAILTYIEQSKQKPKK